MKTVLTLLIFLFLLSIRVLRWLAIVQQKEYRLDRLWLFLLSMEGKHELVKLLPKRIELSRTGLKRPKRSLRIFIVLMIFVTLALLLLYFTYSFFLTLTASFSLLTTYLCFILLLLFYLLAVPMLMIASVLPTTIVYVLKVDFELRKASRKIDRYKAMVIAITGSYGKTSTKLLLAHLLTAKYSVFTTPKSYNTAYSIARSINSDFRKQRLAILEFGAYKKGEIKRLALAFKPKIAVITGLTSQHLGLFGSIDNLIKAKAELVTELASDGVVVYNDDDQKTLAICEVGLATKLKSDKQDVVVKGVRVLASSGLKGVILTQVKINNQGYLSFKLNQSLIETKLVGFHYLETVKLVVRVALELDLTVKEIIEQLRSFVPSSNFIRSFLMSNQALVIDDGRTSNKEGFLASVSLISLLSYPKKVLVTTGIVDLGRQSEQVHLELAHRSKEVFDTIIFLGQVGKKEFRLVNSEHLVTKQRDVVEYLQNIDKQTVILVEGRMPGWIKKYLEYDDRRD